MQVARRTEQAVWKVLDHEGIVLRLDNGEYFQLNEVGLFIWERLDGRMSLDEMVHAVAEMFHVTREQALGDVRAFVQQLTKERLAVASPTRGLSETPPQSDPRIGARRP
jgi:hypothetical protein